MNQEEREGLTNVYQIYAEKARSNGYEYISKILEEESKKLKKCIEDSRFYDGSNVS